jgi:hypothetical protein
MSERVYLDMDDIQQAVITATVIVGTTCARLALEGFRITPERIEEMSKDCVKSLLKKFVVNLH